MPVSTRQQRKQEEPVRHNPDASESLLFSQQVNIAVVRGLRSVTKDVCYSAKVEISNNFFNFLQSKYGLSFAFKENEALLDDFRIVRANFKNKNNYSKAMYIKVALRRPRSVEYKSFSDGKLESTFLSPLPCFCISFFRDDKVLFLKKCELL
jgi:hypothetical protein